MANIKLNIEVPFDELCDQCKYIRYANEGSSANCNVFSDILDTNPEDQYTPCKECLEKRG